MDGKMKEGVCIKFRAKLGKSRAETLEMPRETLENIL
jgi:hypothetical protein